MRARGGKTIFDHELQLDCSRVLEMDPTQIPTGRYLDVKGTPQDFTTGRRLGDDIDSEFNHMKDFRGYDHYFVLDGWKQNILSRIGELRCEATGRKVEVLVAGGAMVYRNAGLPGGCPVTKSGSRYEDYAGVAIEVPELSRRGEPSRLPVGRTQAGRDILPEDRFPSWNVLIRHNVIGVGAAAADPFLCFTAARRAEERCRACSVNKCKQQFGYGYQGS